MDIYNIDGTLFRSVSLSKDAVHEQELMKSNFIRLTWNDRVIETIPVGSYILVDGVKYMLLEDYSPKQNRHRSFTYTPEFQHPVMWLSKIPFWQEIADPSDPTKKVRRYDWSYANFPQMIANYLASFIQGLGIEDLNDTEKEWTALVDERIQMTGVCAFSSVDVLSACSVIANTFDCQFNIDFEAKQIRFGNPDEHFSLRFDGTGYEAPVLKSGQNVGVASVTETKEEYHNAYLVQGSTRNLSKKSDSGDPVQVTERLTLLPDTNPDSIIYLNGDTEVTKEQFDALGVPMLFKSLIFDDIYPKYNLFLYNIRERRRWLIDSSTKEKISATQSDGWDFEGGYYKYYSEWYFRLAYYTNSPISGKSTIHTESKEGKTYYWYDYDLTDEAHGKVTSNTRIPELSDSFITDIPADSNIFTGDKKRMPPDKLPMQTVPYYEVTVKKGNTTAVMAAFGYNGYIVLTNDLTSSSLTFNVGDTFTFVGGVNTAYFDDEHRTSQIIKNKVLSISFQPNYDSQFSSPLTARDFELVHFNTQTTEKSDDDINPNGFTAQKGDYRIVFTEDNGLRLPTTFKGGLYPKPKTIETDGDVNYSYPTLENNIGTLFNIVIDETWKTQAQLELKQKALSEIARLKKDLNKYSLPYNSVMYRETPLNLSIGQRVTYNNGQDLNGGSAYILQTQVIKLVTRLDKPEITTVTVGNEKTKGSIQTMKEQIETIIAGGVSSSSGGGMTESQFVNLLINHGDKRYIRRDINDETDTDLTANKFVAKEGVKTDTIGGKTGDTVGVENNLEVGDNAVVHGDTELNGDVTIGNSASDEALIKAIAKVFQQIQSSNYSGDSPFDVGWMIKNADAKHGNASYMVIDNLFVRMKAIFTELDIRKISYAGGNIVFSHAGSTLVKVVPLTTTMQPTIADGKLTISGDLARVENGRLILDNGTVSGNRLILDGSQEVIYAYRCYIKKDDGTTATENWWRADDQARCQTFNIDETGTYHDVSNSFYWRMVMNVGSETPIGETTDEVMDYVDLSAIDCITGSTVPQAGDVIVQMGNRTDVSRQGFISLEVYGDDAPAFKVYKNVNGYTLNNKMPIIISPYNTSIRARRLSIETDYDVQIVPMERGDWSLIPGHKCYYYDQVQHNGSTWLCVFPEEGSGGVKYTTEEPSLKANWWKVVAQAGKDGSDGKSFNILGSYDTMAELIEAHPTGSVGDAYIVAGDLVVWSDETKQWSNSGRIQGETGNGISGATIHYGTSASNTTVPTNWTANYADLPYTQGEWIWTRVVLSYTDGTSANPYYTQARIGVDGSYKSTAFTRSNKQLSATTPTGGDYSNPLPNQQTVQGEVITWSDGIPAGEAIVWATSRVFTPAGASSGWSTPRQMTDTSSNDVEFSANATKPANPADNESERDAQGWRDVTRNPSFDFTTAIWRAERTKQNGVWSAWVIEKIKGESITKTSEDVKYALSDSGTVAPQSGWQTTKPTSTDTMRWIWTRTIITWSDTSTTTLYQAERDPNDGIDGMEIVVGTQTVKYAVTDNGSSHPSEDSPLWQDTYTPVQGKWLWSKITTPYIYDGGGSAGTTVSFDVSYIAVDGAKGDNGRGISRVDEYYLAGNSSTTPPTGTWVTNPNNAGWSATNKYLWNYEDVIYTDSTSAPTTKSVVAIWSKDGKGIDSIVNYYKASSNPNEPRPAVDGTEGWTTSIQTISPDAIYLHNYEKITYSDGSTPYRSDSHIIGHWGMDALEASQLVLFPSLVSIPTDTDGVVLEDFRQEIEVSMKTYSDVLALKSVDFTANENVVVEASTKIVVKATKGTTLTERTVSITATALDEDGNEYNGYNELTVQRQYRAEKPQFPSMVFKRSVTNPATPTGGTYTNPIPEGWDDGIPSGTGIVWASVCTFYGDGTTSGWSEPQAQIDTDNLDLEFSASTTEPSAPTGDVPFADHESEGWYDPTSPNLPEMVIWRAERKVKNGAYDGDWVVTRIYGEKGDTGADAINVALSPFAVLFSQDVSSDDDTAAHAIAQITPETIASQVVVTKGETPITTGVVVSVSSTSHFNTSGVTIEGTTITLDKDGIQVYEKDGRYYPYDNGYVDLNVAYNGENYTLRLQFHVNLMGKFKTAIEGDVETSIASKTWYEYNPATGEYDKTTTMGEFIRSSSKNTSQLTETDNDTISAMSEVLQKVDNISLTVYENKDGIDLFTHTDDVVVGTSWTTIPTTSNTTNCKTMCVSIPMEIEKKSADSTINFRIYTKNTSGGATIDTIIQSCKFNNGVLTSTGNKSRFDAITSYVRDSKEYVKGVLYFEKTQSSTFKMVDVRARNTGTTVSCTLFKSRKFSVGVSLKDGLIGTGIDIVNGKITNTADQWECQNNSGVKTAWLDEDGNFTVTGVYNNLITIIDWNNNIGKELIIDQTVNGTKTYYIDALRCGDYVWIKSLPEYGVAYQLPYYVDSGNYTRGWTRFLTGVEHQMSADEMRQLTGRRISIKIDDNLDDWGTTIDGAFHFQPYPTNNVELQVKNVANGQHYFYVPVSNYVANLYSYRRSTHLVPQIFHIECVSAVFSKNETSPDFHSYGYVWLAESSVPTTNQEEGIDDAWRDE